MWNVFGEMKRIMTMRVMISIEMSIYQTFPPEIEFYGSGHHGRVPGLKRENGCDYFNVMAIIKFVMN